MLYNYIIIYATRMSDDSIVSVGGRRILKFGGWSGRKTNTSRTIVSSRLAVQVYDIHMAYMIFKGMNLQSTHAQY